MELLAIHVGGPKLIAIGENLVKTSIFKEPVTESVDVGYLNIEGDRQSDLTVHGGPDKAVYVYPAMHYPYWRAQYPDIEFEYGMFGENLTISDVNEVEACIGDSFRIGTASFVVTQPRFPCFKLNIRLNRADAGKRMMASMHNGFYLKVLEKGTITPGDTVEWLNRDARKVRVADIVMVVAGGYRDIDRMERALEVDDLALVWRETFEAKLAE